MPLWRVYCNPATFSAEQKAGFAKAVTKLYTDPPGELPAFYVNVLFIPLREDEMWIGGEVKKNFVRIVIEQIARGLPNPNTEEGQRVRKMWMSRINEALKPFIADRPELEWEHHVAETPRDLWRIQGLEAPPKYSEAEKEWVRTNKPRPWSL